MYGLPNVLFCVMRVEILWTLYLFVQLACFLLGILSQLLVQNMNELLVLPQRSRSLT